MHKQSYGNLFAVYIELTVSLQSVTSHLNMCAMSVYLDLTEL